MIQNNNLKENINLKLITLFFRQKNNESDKMIFSEEFKYKYHINAIQDIERQLRKYNIYHCTPNYDSLSEFGYYYANNGSVLVANASTCEYNYYAMFIPELEKCDIDNCRFIRDCLSLLKKADQIDIHRVDGEFLKTFANVDVNSDEKKFLKK